MAVEDDLWIDANLLEVCESMPEERENGPLIHRNARDSQYSCSRPDLMRGTEWRLICYRTNFQVGNMNCIRNTKNMS